MIYYSRIAFLFIIISITTSSAQFFDEIQELETECFGEGAFFCMGGGCVSKEKYCDGMYDCQDGSDENFCTNHLPDVQYCNETHQYLCSDGRKCIPATWVCNNDPDCADGSDEVNCTTSLVNENSTCKGFQCDGTHCISNLWMCDGRYDCEDKSDEDIQNTCRHAQHTRRVNDGTNCPSSIAYTLNQTEYQCLDKSFCLSFHHMCDGIKDCRDGSDEGHLCDIWHTMCNNFTCFGDGVFCKPERAGPTCQCMPIQQYNESTRHCENVNHCLKDRPACSHKCIDQGDSFKCRCDHGYFPDFAEYLCFAPDPEPMLFFSTRNDIRYMKVKSKQQVAIAGGLKQAHGVSYDGTFVYWVETAQGHQSIFKANLNNVAGTKQVIAALGLEEPGDIALDYFGGNIYFTDTGRGVIALCKNDGSMCTTLTTQTKHPKFITVNPRDGKMYWADWHGSPVIMRARMDGAEADTLVQDLDVYATGLALDAPNERLYFVDQTIKVVKLSNKRVYSLFEEPFHHPYSLAVFENTVYWSDWTSNTVQTADKLHDTSVNRHILLALKVPVFDMQIYHPVLMSRVSNPCAGHNCSHFCLVTSSSSFACGCPEGMELKGHHCEPTPNYRPQYLVVGAGSTFARVQYAALGNPETHGLDMNIARVQAMAYDSLRDKLYIYDGQRKSINYIAMSNYKDATVHLFIYEGLENVVDMAYDFVSDSLYVLDAGRRLVEVVSLRNKHRALVYVFSEQELPISFCVVPEHGRFLVALVENEDNNDIHIDSIGLDGSDRQHLSISNLLGPYVFLRYSPEMDIVYMSDEGHGIIEEIHPAGTGRQSFREVPTTIASMAVTDTHVFWTDRRSAKLYWADVHDTRQKTRRLEFSIFPNNTHLHIVATFPPPNPNSPLTAHKCFQSITPCSHICVQSPQPLLQEPKDMGYKCFCPPGLRLVNDVCKEPVKCETHQLYCHKSNECFLASKKCDGEKDCSFGEDEEGCFVPITPSSTGCQLNQMLCNGSCISKNDVCKESSSPPHVKCEANELRCANTALCIERTLECDGHTDCPDGSDEDPAVCDTKACLETEFMCGSGVCIPVSWRCDKSEDCADGSDEIGCVNKTCSEGYFQCKNDECIALEKRCDHNTDCLDESDEEDCDLSEVLDIPDRLPSCEPWEYSCEHNRSICLPFTARCNARIDCPGGTDEDGCDLRCAPSGGFGCKQEFKCIGMQHVCNGRKECTDGSDETAEACARVNKTGPQYAGSYNPNVDCHNGYRCDNGQCLDWSQVCDSHQQCFDGSDENGLCSTLCDKSVCKHDCRASPKGPQCACPHGYVLRNTTCEDVDECAGRACSHVCHNLPGGFICSCHWGYALRSDRRSCKARGSSSLTVYASGADVWSLSQRQAHTLEYRQPSDGSISDLDYHVRKMKLYIASEKTKELIEVKHVSNVMIKTVITNVGTPSKVTLDWITGNVYFVDNTPSDSYIRVCNFEKKRCAKLLKLPNFNEVTALTVDPANHRLFYCISDSLDVVVSSASLSGRKLADLVSLSSCSGLTADSFTKTLYISSKEPGAIFEVDYNGDAMTTTLSVDAHIKKPHSLHLFEDHIYFLSGSNLNRCLLFGSKTCINYGHLPNATSFMISQESVQRDDIWNSCEGSLCSNVCVLDEDKAKCVCHDGSLSGGECPAVKQSELPLFDGAALELGADRTHRVSVTLVTVVVVLFVVYLCAFVHYHRTRRGKTRSGDYVQVRYENSTQNITQLTNPILEVPTSGGSGHEFINPLQFVRNIWEDSIYRKSRPIGTAGLVFETQRDFSDTESDIDVREDRKLYGK